jgi:hypothetical protein
MHVCEDTCDFLVRPVVAKSLKCNIIPDSRKEDHQKKTKLR